MNSAKICTVGLLLPLLFLLLAAQSGPATVSLTIKHNGRPVALPPHVTLSFDNQSIDLAIRNGRFEVPPGVLQAKSVTFSTVVEGDEIRAAGINGVKFTNEDWTLVLEDHRFSKDFAPLPKGTAVRSACAIIFQPKASEGTVEFVWHCRSKIDKPSPK